jgi:hypothetical protein
MTNVPDPEQFRIELGELDDRHSRFQRMPSAWTTYLHVAAKVHPPVISSLLTDHGLAIIARLRDGWSVVAENPAEAELEEFIAGWCGNWGFIEHFARIPARNTLGQAFDAHQTGKPFPRTFVCDVHGRRYDGTGLLNMNLNIVVKNESTGEITELRLGAKLQLRLPDFHWDRTRETLSDAQKRITNAIKPLVRAELETIRDSYLADDYEPVVRKRDRDRHFEWLARNRVRREPVLSIVKSLEQSHTTQRDVRTV